MTAPDDEASTADAAPARPVWRRPSVLVAAAQFVAPASTATVAAERRRNAQLTVPHGTITRDHGDFYRFEQRRSTIDVLAASTNRFGNLRALFWGRDAVRSTDPGPWRVCARVVGRDLSSKVWATATPAPSWRSPRVEHVKPPQRRDVAGYRGAYLGHIKPEGSFRFTDLESRKLSAR